MPNGNKAKGGLTLSNYIMVIDGGTTNTRFTLLRDTVKIASVTKKIGASNTCDSTRNEGLELAVREAIEEMEATCHCRIETILASGMITSNVGLVEVAHLEAPVILEQLASFIEPRCLSHIAPHSTFYFVPGIKFNGAGKYDQDILRGEETEIYGAISQEEKDQTLLFFHFGSHNKIILYKDRAITKTITTLGGELLWAIVNNTILKSSIGDIDQFELNPDYVFMGYETAEELSFSRSLFTARINQVMNNVTAAQTLSYVYGILIHADLQSFESLLQEETDKIFLYGREYFVKAFLICLEKYYSSYTAKIKTVSFEESEKLSLSGLIKIYGDLNSNENLQGFERR